MTAQQEDWGPWQDHDGKGCPCVGKYVHCEYTGGYEYFAVATGNPAAWEYDWLPDQFNKIIRYRIRKPRALLDLIQLIADLPAPVKTDGVIA